MDDLDAQILAILQREGRASIASIAERIGLSEAPTWRRVRRLEEEGWITGYGARVDRRKLGEHVFAIVSVRFASHELDLAEGFADRVCEMPQVVTCHNVTGEVDYILSVSTRDLEDYERFSRALRAIPGVVSIQTHISLREVKPGGAGLPR